MYKRQLVCCSVQMFLLNWKLALVVILVLPPLAVISWKFQKGILAAYRQVRKTNSQITAGFNEGINGAKTTKTPVSYTHLDVYKRQVSERPQPL